MDRSAVRKHQDFANFHLTEAQMHHRQVLESLYAYEEGMVKIVLGEAGCETAHSCSDVIAHIDCPIKIEHYEKLSAELYACCEFLKHYFEHDGPVTAHLFISPAESLSFPMHTDPDDVLVLMVKGNKTFRTLDGEYTLKPGESLFIPANTKHQAINHEDSLMISFGLEKFIVDKL